MVRVANVTSVVYTTKTEAQQPTSVQYGALGTGNTAYLHIFTCLIRLLLLSTYDLQLLVKIQVVFLSAGQIHNAYLNIFTCLISLLLLSTYTINL